MAASIPTTEPTSARAGDTWRWTRDLADYPASTWTLVYSLFSSAAVYAITATADGTTHSVSVPGTTTGSYTAGRYDWIAHVSDGTDRYQVGAGVIEILPNIAATTDAATLATGVIASNNALTWTAATAGAAGNALSVALIDPGSNSATLAVTVSGTAVRASLATNSGGTITTTATQLAAAVAASSAAAALVTVANTSGSDGTGVVTALAQTSLAGGRDAYSTYDGRSHARKMLDALNAILEGRALAGDLDLVRTSFGDRQAEYDLANLLKARQQYAAAVAAEDAAAARAAGRVSGMVQMRF